MNKGISVNTSPVTSILQNDIQVSSKLANTERTTKCDDKPQCLVWYC